MRMTQPGLFTDYPDADSSITGSEKNQDIVRPGNVILTCKPFAYSVSGKYSRSRCDTCLKA